MLDSEFIAYLRRYARYFEGVAEGLDNPRLMKRVQGLRETIKQFEKEKGLQKPIEERE